MDEHIGPRLRRLREQRSMTLTALSAETGISVSTLSRLESGQRRPALDLLLPIARAHGVTLDHLAGAADPDDPRVHPEPIVRHGVTYLPLTRRPGAPHAFKLLYPPHTPPGPPTPQSHEGYEWLYVISGRLRLVLGGHDLLLAAGEAAEFDTHTPHWFANPTDTLTEVLSLFGPQGERVHVRARPARAPISTGTESS
ncbi:helix-turn-helix domain-containing protein [Dactylosporangium sp. CA-092794]|uniref:helix-turn-helix domain-containing protein n=1 Tax=Dactylosporangium sp. CA-092794 TaxID=3239929 RepID=UPI003D8C6C04